MTPRIRSTNLASPKPEPTGKPYRTGIDKQPVAQIEVFAPGPRYGDGPGVVGDHVGDVEHHGGAQKAVYAARRHRVAAHRRAMTGMFVGGLIVAGAFTFLPGRLMWAIFFGPN